MAAGDITTSNNRFRFVHLTKAQYDNLGANLSEDNLYFLTDIHAIYKGSTPVTDGMSAVANHTALTALKTAGTAITGRIYLELDTMDTYYFNGTDFVFIAGIYSDGAADALDPDVIKQTTPGTYDDAAAGVETTTARQVVTYVESVKAALTQVINNISAGVNAAVHAPVASTSELAALNLSTENVSDKTICLVENKGAIYRYDADHTLGSGETADGDKVVAPGNSQPGYWIKILTANDVVLTNILTPLAAATGSVTPSTVGASSGTVSNGKLGTNTVGTSEYAARADHKHELDLTPYYATSGTTTVGGATGTVSNCTLGTSSVGSSQQFAKADHTHALNLTPYYATSAPENLASAAAAGTSQKFAKEDHVHSTAGLALEEDVVWYTVATA